MEDFANGRDAVTVVVQESASAHDLDDVALDDVAELKSAHALSTTPQVHRTGTCLKKSTQRVLTM